VIFVNFVANPFVARTVATISSQPLEPATGSALDIPAEPMAG